MSTSMLAALWRGERTTRGIWLWPPPSQGSVIMPMRTRMLERIRLDPQAEYDEPLDVLEDVRLTFAQKQSVLESWELDARRLAEAATEGMAGGEESRLREVALARHALDEQDRNPLEKR